MADSGNRVSKNTNRGSMGISFHIGNGLEVNRSSGDLARKKWNLIDRCWPTYPVPLKERPSRLRAEPGEDIETAQMTSLIPRNKKFL